MIKFFWENKTIRLVLIMMFLTFLLLTLTGCGRDNEEIEELNKKITEEIKYLDNRLIYILNSLNNISYDNYTVLPIEIEEGKIPDAEKSSSTVSKSEQKKESEEDKNQEEQKEEKKEQTKVISGGILNNTNNQIDWGNIKKDIENLHDIWSTIILDLYKSNADSTLILDFGKQLDVVTSNIEKEDKVNTIISLAELYQFIPQYSSSCLDDFLTNMYKTKANIILSYSAVEIDNWENVTKNLKNAEESFSNIMNNIEYKKEKEYAINKTYILLKELQNSISMQNKNIYYIKYKNLIYEISMICA